MDSVAGIFTDTFNIVKEPKVAHALTENQPLLKSDSPMIDRGKPIANINDGFSGKSPDIGAIEYGDKLPHYGPRSE